MATLAELEQLEQEELKRTKAEISRQEQRERDIMSLSEHLGWKALVEELTEELEFLDQEILDISSDLSDKDLREKRIQRYYLKKMIELPSEKRKLFHQRKSEGTQRPETLVDDNI